MARIVAPLEIKTDEPTIAALTAITGYETIHTQDGEISEGKPRYVDGYTVNPLDEHTFKNELFQVCVVPGSRVKEEMGAIKPAPTPAPEAAPELSKPAKK